MKFNDLSIQEKAAVIKLGVGGGLRSLQEIQQFWDGMPEDPPGYYEQMEKVANENYHKWGYNNPDEALVHALNDNTYDYRGFYRDNHNAGNNAETHWPDTYKTVYHPTFSNESRYSGIIDKNFNPEGKVGGRWSGDNFIPAKWQNKYAYGGPKKKLKSPEEILAEKYGVEPMVADNTNIIQNPVYTPQEKSYAAAQQAFYERHKSPEAEEKVLREARQAVKNQKAAEFGTLDTPQSSNLQYAWRRFNNSKGSELLYPLPGIGEAMFGTDVADKLYSGNYGEAAKDLALYGTMTYAPEILQGIKTTIKPYWNTNIAPKLEQAWMKITHPSYQKVYHGTPVDFDPTKFHSSTNEFGLHVAPQKQVAQHFTSGYVNGQFVPNGVIKEFYVPKPRHRTIDMHNNGLNLLSKDEIWQHGIGGEFDDVSSLMGGSDFNIKDKDILDRLGLIEGKDYLLSKSGKYTPELINQSYFTNAPNFRYFLSRKDIHANPREILGIKGDKLSLELDDLMQQRQAFNISPYTPMQKIPEDVRLSLQNINDKAGQLLYENGIPTIGYWNQSPIEGAQWNYIVTDPRAIKLPRHNFRINAYGGDLFSKGGSIHIKPENRGKFTALKKRTGHSATWFKKHGTPAQKKMATFALNARKWHHKHPDGGYLDRYNFGPRYNTPNEFANMLTIGAMHGFNWEPEKPIDQNELYNRQMYLESEGNPMAYNSGSKAVGLFQITPIALQEYLNYNPNDTGNLYDPEYNKRVRDWHMQHYYDTVDWSKYGYPSERRKYQLSSAFFNYGKGNVNKSIEKARKNGLDIYNGDGWMTYLPDETKNYVNFLFNDTDASKHKTQEKYQKWLDKGNKYIRAYSLGGLIKPFSYLPIPEVRY